MSDPRRETAQKARKQGFGGNRETETAGRPWPIVQFLALRILTGQIIGNFLSGRCHTVASYWAAETVRESINQIGPFLSSFLFWALQKYGNLILESTPKMPRKSKPCRLICGACQGQLKIMGVRQSPSVSGSRESKDHLPYEKTQPSARAI